MNVLLMILMAPISATLALLMGLAVKSIEKWGMP